VSETKKKFAKFCDDKEINLPNFYDFFGIFYTTFFFFGLVGQTNAF
jgi:hypothetical protein